MSSDYSVSRINNHLPSGSGSAKYHSALVVRKHDGFNEGKKNILANLTDDEILLTSINYAKNKTDKTVAGKLANALPSLFITAVPLALGVLHKGKLSDKVKTALSTTAIFGGASILFNKYDKGMDRIENASKKIEKAREEHPLASSIFDFTAKAALLFGGYALAIKSGKFLQNKFKPSAERLNKTIAKTSDRIDASILGRNVEKLSAKKEAFLDKHSGIAKFASKSAFFAPFAALIGWFGFEGAVQHKALKNQYSYASQMADSLLLQREIARAED